MLAICFAGGCNSKNGAGRTGRVEGETWPFWPATMRVHPSTRVMRDEPSGRFVIETRIELFDPDGVTSKGVGQLTLELHDASSRGDEPVQIWNQDLRDLELNRRQYETVTRTYLFRLEIDASVFPNDPELKAFFLSADGQTLAATMRLRM
jgi:hypothetical protein